MFKSIKAKVAVTAAGVVAALAPVMAFADDPTPSEQITTSMTTGFTAAVGDILAGISAVLPVLIPVVAAIALISVGYRLFKRFAK
jgi:hypothetical protein